MVLFLQDGRKCRLRGHVTDVHKPLISAGNVLDKGKVAILQFQWGFDSLLGLTHWKLDLKSNDEGHGTVRRTH